MIRYIYVFIFFQLTVILLNLNYWFNKCRIYLSVRWKLKVDKLCRQVDAGILKEY